MKLIYEQRPILEKINREIITAASHGRKVQMIILSPKEWKELQQGGIGFGHDTFIDGVKIVQRETGGKI